MQKFKFLNNQEGEAGYGSAVLLTIVPIRAKDWEIGPHRKNTGMALYHVGKGVNMDMVSWYGPSIPEFSNEDYDAAAIAAGDVIYLGCADGSAWSC